MAYTQTLENVVARLIISDSQKSVDQYLVDTTYITPGYHAPQQYFNFIADLEYDIDINNRVEFIFNSANVKNFLLTSDTTGLLYSYQSPLKPLALTTRWIHEYNEVDKLFTQFTYTEVKNLPYTFENSLENYCLIVRNLNTVNSFDIFNEVAYRYEKSVHRSYIDYSAGIKYHANDSFSFALKGENLFDRAKENRYGRLNATTLQAEEPLSVSPIDRRVFVSMEYLF